MASLNTRGTIRSLSQSHPGLTEAQVQVLSKSPLLKSHSSVPSIDIVYGTFWFPPSQEVELVTPEMKRCLDKWLDMDMEAKLRLGSYRSDMDHDAYVDAVTRKCETETGISQNSSRRLKQKKHNLFGKKMGSLTIYRQSLTCKEGGSFKPMNDQIWSGYLGGNKAHCTANL